MHHLKAFLLCMVAGLAPAAHAQDGTNPFGGGLFDEGATGQESFGDSRDVVGTSFVATKDQAVPGTIVPIEVTFDIKPGWHIWTNEDGVPEGVTAFDGAIWTEIGLDSEAPLEFEVTWPEAHLVKADLGFGPEDYAVFDGKAVAVVNLRIPGDAPSGKLTCTISAMFQACDDSTCLMPTFDRPTGTIELNVLPAGSSRSGGSRSTSNDRGGRSDPGSKDAPSVPTTTTESEPVDSEVRIAETDSEVDGAEDTATVSAPPETAAGSSFFGFRIPKTDGGLGLLILILMSIAGGFILNLTPCVLPVIPIKIMTISQHAGSGGHALSLGLWMAFGVFAFWLAIGLPVAFLTTFTDPSAIFGIWWVTLAIGLLIGLMGIGIMGLFTLQLPQSVYMVNPKADNAGGSFLFGVMTAVLGLPCFGFVAGALLAGTATLPAWITLVIFGSIGAGMALPYLVLSARPSLVEKIPRTGPASELVKQMMGLLLLAAAAYFIGAGLIALTAEMPWMARQIHWWAIAVAMIVAGGWLALRTFQITKRPGPRLVWTLAALFMAIFPTLFAMQTSEKAHAIWLELDGLRSGDAKSYSTRVWNPYTPERLEAARADGKIVVVDFTAEWCLNCKALKAAVLDVDPVKSRLTDDPDIVTLTADNTSRNAPGWALMKDLGQTGIPLLAIWGPEDDMLGPWQSNAYTASQVLDAIKAREAR